MKTFPFERIGLKYFGAGEAVKSESSQFDRYHPSIEQLLFLFTSGLVLMAPSLACSYPPQEAAGFRLVLRVVSRPPIRIAGSTSAVHCVRRNPIQGPFFLCWRQEFAVLRALLNSGFSPCGAKVFSAWLALLAVNASPTSARANLASHS